jgi:hypothetical protein
VNQGPQYLEGRYTLALPSPSRLAISVAPSPAVKALRAWLDAAGIEAEPLFRPINKAGTVAASRLTCRSINRIGLRATTFGGTGDGLPDGCAAYFAGHNVVVLADNDEGGRQHAERKAALIAPTAASVRVLHFPELAEKADVSDWIAAGHSADDLRERADAAPVWLPTEFVSAPITPLAGRHLISHRASDIQPERLQWVWPGRIARGKVALLGGPPGLGKSQLALLRLSLAAAPWSASRCRAPSRSSTPPCAGSSAAR